MALVELVTNHYHYWTQGGDLPWSFYDGTAVVNMSLVDDYTTYTSTIEKSFTLTRLAGAATLTVKGSRYVYGSPNETARILIELQDADGAWHTLRDLSGSTGGSVYYMYGLDIASYLSKAGTYTLRFTAIVKSVLVPDPPSSELSWVKFEDVSLQVDSVLAWEELFDETAATTESLVGGLTLIEEAAVVEYFDAGKTTPAVSKEERLLAAKTDTKVYIFETGTPEGSYETDDEDYGHPGMDKTLDEVQLESNASAPHTIEVKVSLDSGLTWTSIGTVVAQRGKACSVFACVTDEKHRVCFSGAGLRLSSYKLLAIPRGRMPKK